MKIYRPVATVRIQISRNEPHTTVPVWIVEEITQRSKLPKNPSSTSQILAFSISVYAL